jgi:hypothetical protein
MEVFNLETFLSFCIWNCSTLVFFPAAAHCISFLLLMTVENVDSAVDAFERTLELLKPFVAEKAPHLL